MRPSLFAALSAPLVVSGLLALPAAAHEGEHRQAGAHVHGVADLALALDGQTLTVEFESPLDSILGFEHPPETKVQTEQLEAALAQLRDPGALIQIPAKAGCTVTTTPDIDLPPGFTGPPDKTAAAPDHDEAHDHDDGDHEHHHDHANIHLSHSLTCKEPAALTDVTVTAFRTFTRLRTVKVAFLSDRTQKADSLTPERPTLSWR
ncbi:ZrgA family zinc uptake protein [Oleisolibacter albus]|uniref:ZrgA family zinc uptake protein n=1 Tax=Oleisolibacter albus TaxID=2171757 RepID=UPI001390105C|nr:DUF2796 domain-containing protein [Oleisolibacter albus]